MSITPMSSLDTLTTLADQWEKLGGNKADLFFRSVADLNNPFIVKPSWIKRFFLWLVRPWSKQGEILGKKVIFYDQKSNLAAIHNLVSDALKTYFSQKIKNPADASTVQKIIDFALELDAQFEQKPALAKTFRRTVRALPSTVALSSEICSVASEILQKEEISRPKMMKTLMQKLMKDIDSSSANEVAESLQSKVEAISQLEAEPFSFDHEMSKTLIRKLQQAKSVDGGLIGALWAHFPEEEHEDLFLIGLRAIDQAASLDELEKTVRMLDKLTISKEDRDLLINKVFHAAEMMPELDIPRLLSIRKKLSSALSGEQTVRMGALFGRALASAFSQKTLLEIFRDLPEVLEKLENLPVDCMPLRDLVKQKTKESFDGVLKGLHIVGIKSPQQVESVHIVVEKLSLMRPKIPSFPQEIQKQFQGDYLAVVAEVYPIIQKQLLAAAARDISSLTSEKALQDALKTIRSVQEVLAKEKPLLVSNPFEKEKRVACLEYVAVLLNDLLRPLKKSTPVTGAAKAPSSAAAKAAEHHAAAASIDVSEKEGVTRRLIGAALPILSQLAQAGVLTVASGGGYPAFVVTAQMGMIGSTVIRTVGAPVLSCVTQAARKIGVPEKVASTIGQLLVFAATRGVTSSLTTGSATLAGTLASAARAAVVAPIAASAQKPICEATTKYLGTGVLGSIAQGVGCGITQAGAGQVLSIVEAPVESLQSVAKAALPTVIEAAPLAVEKAQEVAPQAAPTVAAETPPQVEAKIPTEVAAPSPISPEQPLSEIPLAAPGFFESLWSAAGQLFTGGAEYMQSTMPTGLEGMPSNIGVTAAFVPPAGIEVTGGGGGTAVPIIS